MDFVTIVLLIVILFSAVLRTPLFLVLGFVALLLQTGLILESSAGRSITTLQELLSNTDDKLMQDSLLVPIPLFCLVGYLLSRSKTPERIVDMVDAMIGWLPGSMGIVTIIACAFFTPFTGASGITIIALGGLLYPILIREKYGENYSLGVMTSSGSIGLLFFPSLPILLIAVIGHMSISEIPKLDGTRYEIPIRDMYLAGILPGILLITIPSIYTFFKRRNHPSDPNKLKEARANMKANLGKIIAEMGILPIILFLFFSGVIDLTDTGVITLGYFFVLEYFVFDEISRDEIMDIVKEALILTGGIIIIIITAQMFTSVLIDMEIEKEIYAQFKAVDNKIVFLIILNLILLVVGAIMDVFSAILIVVPLLLPTAVQPPFNIDPIHFCIIFLTNLEIGYCTPPVGLNLFISSFRFNKPLLTLYKASLPFLAMMLVSLVVITYVPSLSLALIPDKKKQATEQVEPDKAGGSEPSLEEQMDTSGGSNEGSLEEQMNGSDSDSSGSEGSSGESGGGNEVENLEGMM
jgi:C4-dicarboxylate transporter DctM subunit